jgi:hypothetical protein
MNTTEKDRVRFSQQSEAVCWTYAQSIERYQRGEHTVSIDEMTGIQALERAAPTKPPRPGFVERREFEYIRHGTQTLIANFEVGSGDLSFAQRQPHRG